MKNIFGSAIALVSACLMYGISRTGETYKAIETNPIFLILLAFFIGTIGYFMAKFLGEEKQKKQKKPKNKSIPNNPIKMEEFPR